MFAGTNHGVFYLTSPGGEWLPASMIAAPVPEWQPKPAAPEPAPVVVEPKSAKRTVASRRKVPVKKAKVPPEPVIAVAAAPAVRSLQSGEQAWYAATDDGLFISVDHGLKWYEQPVEGESNFISVNSYQDGTITLAGHNGAYLSPRRGQNLDDGDPPQVCQRHL